MNLRKKWLRLLGTFGGRKWATLRCWCGGDGHYNLDGYNGKEWATVRFRPDGWSVDRLIRSLLAEANSVPAYALSDALREEMEGDPNAVELADMLKATLPRR